MDFEHYERGDFEKAEKTWKVEFLKIKEIFWIYIKN